MNYLAKQKFAPTAVGILINPYYSIRSRLHKAVSKRGAAVRGVFMDFGCGSKPYRECFPFVSEYIGVDIEVSGHPHKDSKIDVFYNGSYIPFGDDYFDAVMA